MMEDDPVFIEALKCVLAEEWFIAMISAKVKDMVATEFNHPENQELLKKVLQI